MTEINSTTADQFNARQLVSRMITGTDITYMMKTIQHMLSVEEDGKCGENTIKALRAKYAPLVTVPAKTFPLHPSVQDWVPFLEKYRGGIPLKFLTNWITHESGGNPLALGIPGKEAGIFQSYHPDDDRFGMTFAELRVNGSPGSSVPKRPLTLEEADAHAKAGIALVRNCINRAQEQHPMWHANARYMLAKLYHALPSLGNLFIPAYKAGVGVYPGSWVQFKQWVLSLSKADVARISPPTAKFDLAHLFANAEKTGSDVV